MNDGPDLSIVLPVCNERANLAPLLDEIDHALQPTGRTYEIIAVDDGSTDGSGKLLRELSRDRSWLRVVRFRFNCGQSAAFDAGFRHASGRLVVTMDSDGQNDPADVPRMIETMEAGDYDVAIGNRARRQDGFLLRRLPSRIANFVIRRVTGTKHRDLGCSLRVYRRELTSELHLYGEMHRFISVLVESMGARTVEVDVHHRPRSAGVSKYGLTRTLKVLLDLTTVWFMRGYQTKPIYFFGGIGFLADVGGVLLAGVVLYEKLVRGVWVHRNPLFLVAIMLSVIGVQFLCLGLLAEIMVRTYFESQHKSAYLVAERIGFDAPASTTQPTLEFLAPAVQSRRPSHALATDVG